VKHYNKVGTKMPFAAEHSGQFLKKSVETKREKNCHLVAACCNMVFTPLFVEIGLFLNFVFFKKYFVPQNATL
jgi:hypothetical protein